jgi:hypothetical protein
MTEADYDVVQRSPLKEFIIECRRKVREGWIPLGGIAHTPTQGSFEYYVQAFYKPAKEKIEAAKPPEVPPCE